MRKYCDCDTLFPEDIEICVACYRTWKVLTEEIEKK